jgi:hypothetical protein
MRSFLLNALFPLVLAAQAPAQPDWSFAHPDATLVGGIRPRAILESPLLAAAIGEAAQKEPNAARVLDMARAMLGGVTEVHFSLQDNGTPEPDVIAVVTGQLDESLVSALAQDKAKVRRIDATTLLLGNGASLDKAAARMARSIPTLRPRALQGTAELENSDLWLSGQIPDTPLTAQFKDMLGGLALGISVRDSLDLQLDVNTATAAMAETLVREAHAAAAKQPVAYRGMLQSFVDGTKAHFRIVVPQQLVLEAMRSGQIPGMPAQQSTRLEPLPPPVLVQPPARRTIIIQGLDEGNREIPLQPLR